MPAHEQHPGTGRCTGRGRDAIEERRHRHAGPRFVGDLFDLYAEVRESLRLALALAIGPDPVTMLKDVAGLDAEQTRRVLKSAARSMLHAAVQLDGMSEGESPQAS